MNDSTTKPITCYDDLKLYLGRMIEFLPFYETYPTDKIALWRDGDTHDIKVRAFWSDVTERGRLSVFYDFDGTAHYGISDGEMKFFKNGKEVQRHPDFYMTRVIPANALEIIELKVLNV